VDSINTYTEASVLAFLRQAMPPGLVWESDEVQAYLKGCTPFLTTVLNACGAGLINEADPATATHMLAHWAKVYGLPDCATLPTDVAELRRVVAARGTRGGRHQYNHRLAIADLLGIDISRVTIENLRPFSCGDTCGSHVWGETHRAVWRVLIWGWTLGTPALCGVARCGDSLVSDTSNPNVSCFVEKHKPAYTHAIVAYTDELPGA
jgi:uncharacterized protein YmfQ (DUF2313 family)